MLIPAGTPGVVGVTVTPLDAPGNALAPFDFEYVDDRIPRAFSFSPKRAYADGGYNPKLQTLPKPESQHP